jgi:hypothetical protein
MQNVFFNRDMNPLKPCGACSEWLKKIIEVNPSFSVVTFTVRYTVFLHSFGQELLNITLIIILGFGVFWDLCGMMHTIVLCGIMYLGGCTALYIV